MTAETADSIPIESRAQAFFTTHFHPNTDFVRGLDYLLSPSIYRGSEPEYLRRYIIGHELRNAILHGYVDSKDTIFLDHATILGGIEEHRPFKKDNQYRSITIADIIMVAQKGGVIFSPSEQLYIYARATSNAVDRLAEVITTMTEGKEKYLLVAHLKKRTTQLNELRHLEEEAGAANQEALNNSIFPLRQYPINEFSPEAQQYPVEELDRLLRDIERHLERKVILDSNGKAVCHVEYDRRTRNIVRIHPAPYQNVEEEAEHLDETVNVTNERGEIIAGEHVKRGAARKENRRYLVVSTPIFHTKEGKALLFVQQRAHDKAIDPDKLSISAHGVAKEVFSQTGERITDRQEVALINAALEMSEELRHNAKPFTVQIWPGTVTELYEYAEAHHINDPDTVYMVPATYVQDDAYPLGDNPHPNKARTRAISAGFIFSNSEPPISVDPSEVQTGLWMESYQALHDPEVTRDFTPVMRKAYLEILRLSPNVIRYAAIEKAIMRALMRVPAYERP